MIQISIISLFVTWRKWICHTCYLLWQRCFGAGTYVVGHILVSGADPVVMTEARWALTALLLMIMYHRQVWLHRFKNKNALPVVIFLSVFGQVLFPLTLYIACNIQPLLMQLFICRQHPAWS